MVPRRAAAFLLGAGLLAGGACSSSPPPWAAGELRISFTLQAEEGFDPSRQTVVWLEDTAGRYARPLLVSLWTACGGYSTRGVCPEWSAGAAWDEVSPDLFEAVTAATPRWGTQTVTVDCTADTLCPGLWFYCVETHLQEDRNILFRGRIEIGSEETESRAERVAGPRAGEQGAGILTAVQARYLPHEH